MNVPNRMAQILFHSVPSSRPAKSATPARRTRASITLTASLMLLATTGISNAAILAYEPFNYSQGAINDGTATTASGAPTATTAGGFAGTWFAGGVGATIVDGLVYPGLQTTNNALQWSTSVPYQGENLAAAILPSTTPTVYVSFLYSAPSYTANKSGFALDNGLGANQGYYMGMTASGVFGVATVDNGSGAVLGTAAETISFNTTYFIVVKFEKDSAGAYYKSGSIWINPAPGGSEPAASGTFTGTYTAMNKIADFLTALGGSSVITDEIRLGTTWADVTPANGASAPATPTGLQVDSSGDNTVSLSWTAAAGSPISYNVKRATSSGGTYTTVGTTTAPTVTFTDSLTGGATYYYVVSAVSAGGESADSSFVSATPSLGVPDAPTGLAATAGDNQVALSWTAPAIGNPTSYNVLRSITSGSGYTAITTPGAQTATSYTDTTAVNGTPYYYVVSAVNATGAGANSTEANATPSTYAGAYEPFNYPVDNNLDNGTAATGSGFTGNWNNGVAGWILSGLTYPDLPVANNAMRTPAGRQSVSIDVPISSGTKWISYLWSHSAGDPGGNKNGVYFQNGGAGLYFGVGYPYSATEGSFGLASINTVGTAVDGSPTLLTNTGLTYPYGGTKLIVFKIEFNTSGNNDTVTVYVNPVANQSTPGVAPAATYSSFDVGTISGIGMQVSGGGDFITDEWRIAETYAAAVDAVVVPPNTPTGLNATPGSNSVSLSWTAAGGGLPTGYNVKRSSVFDGPYITVGTTTEPTVTYIDAVLGGSTYYYVVSAVNGVGESTNSSYVTVAPILAAPVAPGGLSATVGDSQVSLSWSASPFATSYEIKRATDINGPYVSIDTTSALTYDDFGVNNSVTYYYVVVAIGAGGASPDTLPISETPIGPLPLVLGIEQGVGITWFASNSVTYYVQWASEDLGTNTVWNNIGESITGTGATNTVFDPVGKPHNYYRVISIE